MEIEPQEVKMEIKSEDEEQSVYVDIKYETILDSVETKLEVTSDPVKEEIENIDTKHESLIPENLWNRSAFCFIEIMPRRRSNLGRRTRGAEAVRRIIANQTEEERASANERNRQRMAQIRAGEAAEQRAVRLLDARLRARRSRYAASERRQRETKHQAQVQAQLSRSLSIMNSEVDIKQEVPLSETETEPQSVKVEIQLGVEDETDHVDKNSETFQAFEDIKLEITSDAVKNEIENIDIKDLRENL
ncbi:hypothetical protein L9F63_023847, partial [Diploptera punctata]